MVTKIWYELLREMQMPRDRIIIEIGPGFKSKIGKAVAEYGFRGDYYIIEPNGNALDRGVDDYRKMMPNAKVYGHQCNFQEIIIGKDIVQQPTYVLGNHVLDDIVLSKGLPSEEARQFFAMNSGIERVKKTKELWERIEVNELLNTVAMTVQEIEQFLERIQPDHTILSHYEGRTLQQQGIKLPYLAGKMMAQRLQKQKSALEEKQYTKIIIDGGYGHDWVVA